LGEALNHVDDLDGALQAFHRSTELRPTNPRALRGLGIVYDRLNRPAEAAQMYRRSRELAGT
jgi:Flp pilus assembly protein TadD